MTENEVFYIIGNIPILSDDENYDICQYQEAKAIALEALEKIQQYKALGTVEELRIAKEKQITHISFQREQSESRIKDTIDYSIFGDIPKSTELEKNYSILCDVLEM